MDKSRVVRFVVFIFIFTWLSLPLSAWDGCSPPSSDVAVEARVAYYHPSSNRVKRIYGSGWADYQLEISKGFMVANGLFGGCGVGSDTEWRICANISGFARKGESIGLHHDTKLQMIPLSLGVKFLLPLSRRASAFIGGAACYSFLRIKDHSEYVHRHLDKGAWGGLIQSGFAYRFCKWGVVSLFADYLFQRFSFHTTHDSSFYSSGYFQDSRYIERHDLNMSGYKIGVGLGLVF